MPLSALAFCATGQESEVVLRIVRWKDQSLLQREYEILAEKKRHRFLRPQFHHVHGTAKTIEGELVDFLVDKVLSLALLAVKF